MTRLKFVSEDKVDSDDRLITRQCHRSELGVAQFIRRQPGFGLTIPNPSTDMLMTVVSMNRFSPLSMWRNGKHLRLPARAPGSLSIYDLRETWVAEVDEPFHSVHLFASRRSLDALSDELRQPRIETLACSLDEPQYDETLLHLVRSLRPALERPSEVNALYADHLAAAINLHVLQTYGLSSIRQTQTKGRLARWQERLARDMIDEHLDGCVTIAELATACGLSPGHFARSFRRTLDVPPYRWLIARRIDLAKRLLSETRTPISEIATACGFCDQSHLTRVFRAAHGSTPQAWRREYSRV